MLGVLRWSLVWIGWLALGSSLLSGASISELRFKTFRPEKGGDEWLEAAIPIEVQRDKEDTMRRHASFIDAPRVEVTLAFRVNRDGKEDFEFFRARADLVSLEQGTHWIRFYLPPEILRRDRIRGTPFAYVATLETGKDLLAERRSESIDAPVAWESFRSRSELSAGRNDGVLRIQQLSPFAEDYPNETVSILRRN